MFFIQVVHGRPGGRLQFSGGGLKMAWLASAFSSIHARCPKKVRRQDLMMDESGCWLVMRRMSAFLTNVPRFFVGTIGPLHQSSLVSCPAFRSTEHYREYEDPVQTEFGLVRYP